ncbi:MAG: hypothetical protein QXM43_06405 [Desulfurococcaceae archaeon]|uniref:hypothetical protein n=1 Tax=Thermoprotei TaxID=183924 RepID=UPI003165FAF3
MEFAARILRARYKVIQHGGLIAIHLNEKRDAHLLRLKGLDERKAKITVTTLIKWLLDYLKPKHGWSWFKFLCSLPTTLKIRFILHSTFLPLLFLLLVFLIIVPSPSLLTAIFVAILAVFLDALRDFLNPKRLHKSIILSLSALVNRSVRTVGALVYIIYKALYKNKVIIK